MDILIFGLLLLPLFITVAENIEYLGAAGLIALIAIGFLVCLFALMVVDAHNQVKTREGRERIRRQQEREEKDWTEWRYKKVQREEKERKQQRKEQKNSKAPGK